MADWIKSIIFTFLLLAISSIIPIALENRNSKKDVLEFLDSFIENFHLNNAATFIGYAVFAKDSSTTYLIFYAYSFLVYLLEVHFGVNLRASSRAIIVIQIIAFLISVIGQGCCAYIILSTQ